MSATRKRGRNETENEAESPPENAEENIPIPKVSKMRRKLNNMNINMRAMRNTVRANYNRARRNRNEGRPFIRKTNQVLLGNANEYIIRPMETFGRQWIFYRKVVPKNVMKNYTPRSRLNNYGRTNTYYFRSKMRNPNNTGFRNAKNNYYRAHGYQKVGAYDLLSVGEEGRYHGKDGSPIHVEVIEVPDSMMIFHYKFRVLGPAEI